MKYPNLTKLILHKEIKRTLEAAPFIYQFLRYSATGFLNTALNFLILNIFSKALNINQGLDLGLVAAAAFIIAFVQSYFWNRTWAFGNEAVVSHKTNLKRLISIGLLGLGTLAVIFIASKFSVPWEFYALLTLVYFVFEWVFWKDFGFHKANFIHHNHSFGMYFLVTVLGLLINTGLVTFISSKLHLTGGDLDKNIAAGLATVVSFAWNFYGYKAIVFKKTS